jgi:hypothetical protein
MVRRQKIIYSLPTLQTWLGPLSYDGRRGRLPPKTGAIFIQKHFYQSDRIMLFTDGVDECIYQIPTIKHLWLAQHSLKAIYGRIFHHGAEDNASLIDIQC